jgi:hypothetical protein
VDRLEPTRGILLPIMIVTTALTRWERESLTPSDYDDLRALVKLARKARGLPVTFDWAFTRAGLLGLQRAVFEWGTPVPGRYRVFDSRVLRAISGALGEQNSVFVLSEPANAGPLVADVTCVAEEGLFRLRGRATFDLIFGYVSAGLNGEVRGAVHLGEAATVLAQAGAALGWDIVSLQDEKYRGVRNALFGMSPAYGVSSDARSSEPLLEVQLRFHGPFAAVERSEVPCVFTSPVALKGGIYLWTVNVNGQERPWYVGQTTRAFRDRIAEHVRGFLSGEYRTYDADALGRGEFRRVAGHEGIWPQNIPSLIANFDKLGPQIATLLRSIRFHLAPLDSHHDRVEGAIGRFYRREHPGYMLPGLQLPAAVPHDRHLRLILSSDTPIDGLQDIED